MYFVSRSCILSRIRFKHPLSMRTLHAGFRIRTLHAGFRMPKYAKIAFQYIELEGLLSSLNFFATFILLTQQVG